MNSKNSSKKTLLTPKNGFELVNNVMAHAGENVIEALLDLAGREETDWLELKASCRISDEELIFLLTHENKRIKDKYASMTSKQLEAEGFFHVAKGVVSLLNHQGGALIIGIKENPLAAIGWEHSCNNKKSLDEFIRKELFPKILFPTQWDIMGDITKIRCENIESFQKNMRAHIHPKREKYKGKEVLLLTVEPLRSSLYPLIISSQKIPNKHTALETFYLRASGDEGQVYGIDSLSEFYKNNHSIMERAQNNGNDEANFKSRWEKYLRTSENTNKPVQEPAIYITRNSPYCTIYVNPNHFGKAKIIQKLNYLLSDNSNDTERQIPEEECSTIITALESIYGKGCCSQP